MPASTDLRLDQNTRRLSNAIQDLFRESPPATTTIDLVPRLVTVPDVALISREHGILCRHCGILLKNSMTYANHIKRCHLS